MRVRQKVQALSRQACLIQGAPWAALDCPILVLGAPRSGTTWLAKIIDSHPDVLYRHEPDAMLPGPSPLTPEALPGLLADWAADQSLRSAAKQPFFAKSWQPGWARWLRTLLAFGAGAAARVPRPFRALVPLTGVGWIPDLGFRQAPRLAIKSIAWADGAAVLVRCLPGSRVVFILRHPCGQVASVMRGNRQRRFDLRSAGTDMPFDETATAAFAASHGAGEAAFQALSQAAKYAWSWRAFNEPAYVALAAQPNVRMVIYEALCADPAAVARQILDFAGLDWTEQTQAFVARSSLQRRRSGYYSVLRNAVAAAGNWRGAMPAADQAAVRSVMSASPLAALWPDILASR